MIHFLVSVHRLAILSFHLFLHFVKQGLGFTYDASHFNLENVNTLLHTILIIVAVCKTTLQ